jgi:hypothetical protein
MAERYLGQLSTDVFGVNLDEVRVGYFKLSAAQAAAAGAVRAAITGSAEAAVVKTDAITNPPYPRNLVVTPGGTTGDVKAGNVVIEGTNILNQPISENFTFLDNASTATTGAKAFKTVTKITVPIQDGAAATFAVTFGDKLGLPIMLTKNPLAEAVFNGVREATKPTVVIDNDEIEKNTIDLHSALDGSVVEVYLHL